MPSRRTFLKSAGLLAVAYPLLSRASGATPVPAESGPSSPGKGLLFDRGDIARIRGNLDLPRFATLRGWIFPKEGAANLRFLREEIRVGYFFPDFIKACHFLENAAFAFALTGDEAQLAQAKLAGQRLCEYERWDYFLEGGRHTFGLQRASEATIAFCLALDWLGEAIDAETREVWERNLAAKGAPACYLALYGMRYPDRVQGWTFNPKTDVNFRGDLSRWPLILNATNLKAMPTCGLGFAAVTLQGRHPEADRWLEMSRQSARSYATMYGLDGSFDEGIGYWGYATTHMALLFEVMHRRMGIDDRKLINFSGSVRYALHMAMPTIPPDGTPADEEDRGAVGSEQRDTVNFGDAGRGIDVSVTPWVGREFSDALANHLGKHIGGMGHVAAAIWYRPDAPTQAPGPEMLDVRMSNDIVVSRTGWAPADGVLALRSGGPANHEHADRNSVIFKAYGERLLNDPMGASYDAKKPRWLLRQTAAHTAVLINGQGHQYHDGHEGTNSSWASAKVTAYQTGDNSMTVTSDATEAYRLVNDAVQLVQRTLVYLKPDVVLVFDRVRLSGTPVPVQVRFQVYNDDKRGSAQVEDNGFTITRPHAQLRAVAQAAGGAALRATTLDLPETEGIYPFVEVESAAATEHTVLTACAAQVRGETAGILAIARKGDAWQVAGSHNGRQVNVTLTVIKDHPLVRIHAQPFATNPVCSV